MRPLSIPTLTSVGLIEARWHGRRNWHLADMIPTLTSVGLIEADPATVPRSLMEDSDADERRPY